MNEHDALDKQLAQAWQALSPPASLEAKVRARIAAGGSPVAAPRAPSHIVRRFRALRASGGVGAAAATLLLALGFLAGYLARPASIERTDAPPEMQAPAQHTPPAPHDLTPAAAPQTAAHPTRSAAPSRSTSGSDTEHTAEHPGASRTSSRSRNTQAASSERTGSARREHGPRNRAHNQELSLLERAERAVRARHPELALVLTAELLQAYPASVLHEERRAIELMAHCQSGSTEAAALAERFTARYPESVYAERISGECNGHSDKPHALGH